MHGMPKNTALVVDDELSNRIILKSLLKRFGYNVLDAADGQTGIDLFNIHRPDVVFMDVLMPGVDGYVATSKIKQLAGERFVPVIFLTALTDEEALVHCIEAGGDDFLTKPFSHVILQSKLRALERIRTLYREVENLYQRMRAEEVIAQKVFNTAVIWKNVVMDQIPHYLRSAEIFNGDILLTAWTPSGDLHLLLGDFTGHGLSAALSAIPTATTFRAMSAKGFSPQHILNAINNKLHNLLPPGMFLAATFLLISKNLDYVQIFNSSMPDALILNEHGLICKRLTSQLMPLGILPYQDMAEGLQCSYIKPGWRILLVSDGVTESSTLDGTFFGQERLDATVLANADQPNMIEAIQQALQAFCGEHELADDTSIVEIPCIPDIFPTNAHSFSPLSWQSEGKVEVILGAPNWQISLVLQGQRLAKINPIPLLINQMKELEETGIDNNQIFAFLTPPYNKVLERCLAKWSPQPANINACGDPICKLRLQQQRLEALPDTVAVRIQVTCEQVGEESRLRVNVEDISQDECLQPPVTAWLRLNS